MSFLAPLFLIGAIAVALPVLFHLIRRKVKDRTVFSSLMFLLPSPPRLTRRSRLEHLLLLGLRCAILCLLAAGFARPFFKRDSPPIQSSALAKRVVVLVDTSASMRRQELWNVARAKAEAYAKRAAPSDALALFAFDGKLTSLVSFEEWDSTAIPERPALVRNRLSATKPGWGSTALGLALIEAAELVDSPGELFSGARQVLVISDFQEGSDVGALQGHPWPKGVQVILERVSPGTTSNAGVQLVTDLTTPGSGSETVVRVRVNNASDSKQEQFQLGWVGPADKQVGKPVSIYVAAGQSRIVPLPVPGADAGAKGIMLTGDDEPFDNAVWVVPPERIQATVVYFGTDREGDTRQPLFFLRQALQDTPGRVMRLIRPDPSGRLRPADVADAALFVVTSGVDETQTEVLARAVESGKTLLLAPSTAEAAASLSRLLGVSLRPPQEHKPENYAMLVDIDFADPLFAPFTDARFSDFTKLHFWTYRKIDFAEVPTARTLARFDTGDPAIVSIRHGKGQVLVLTSGWHPADSQLALSSKFIPLLYSLIELSGTTSSVAGQYLVGATLPLRATALKLQLPRGSEVQLKPGVTNFTAWEPGVYSTVSPDRAARFAVNLAPNESRTAPMPLDELERLGVPGPVATVPSSMQSARKVRLQNAELEATQKLWRWTIVAALAVLGFETWLAGRTARRSALQGEVR